MVCSNPSTLSQTHHATRLRGRQSEDAAVAAAETGGLGNMVAAMVVAGEVAVEELTEAQQEVPSRRH